jgi:predicted DNA-binding WGR domain protein
MLGWHYRSRYETLISYSNHAFYNKNLLTIPDKAIHHNSKTDIVVERPEDGGKNVPELLSRSISYHYLPNSLYEKRSNLDEANYIAHLVKELLVQNTANSIGIVAFSQEQQHQIEDALTLLAGTDKHFEELLEAEYNRTEEEQFVGLIVMNLENIQGHERDIIIMSVCYGFDANKKMLMNFGPINKKGGEKRLNVIFSRAKKHMAIISSIKHTNITNEYNEGANYFKRFLHYAEMVSTGNMATARIILDGLVTTKPEEKQAVAASYMLLQMQKELQTKGYETHISIGQSTFKCSLAVKLHKDDEAYTLGVVVDDDSHYKNENWLEQYFQRPAILQSFGWKVIAIFAKDWLQHPQKALEQIIKRLHQEPVVEKEEILEIDVLTLQEINDPVFHPLADETLVPANNALDFTKLTNTENGSNKFWEAACDGNKMIVRFGKTGTKGQTQIKTFTDNELAEKEKQKMILEKINKGYQIVITNGV